MAFKKWDIVIAKVNRDPSIEAVVDFETDDWAVYISEWWRPLSYPTRLIIAKNKLFLKDKQIKIWRQQMQWLIREFFWEDLDYLNLKTMDSIHPWDILKIRNNKYVFVQKYGEQYSVVWRLTYDYNIWHERITNLYWFTKDEISQNIKTKDEIVRKIFWDNVKAKDVIIVDDTTWESVEE